MMGPGMMINERHQPVAMAGLITPITGSKRRTDYIDPCQIAPLKKRKIQVRDPDKKVFFCLSKV